MQIFNPLDNIEFIYNSYRTEISRVSKKQREIEIEIKIIKNLGKNTNIEYRAKHKERARIYCFDSPNDAQ